MIVKNLQKTLIFKKICFNNFLLFLILSSVLLLVNCTSQMQNNEPYQVKRLKGNMKVFVGDKSLDDWDTSYIVMRVSPINGVANEWKKIRGKTPKPLKDDDIELNIYMAYDDAYWYIAIDALDDRILSVPSNSHHPYSGDCVEIFFAGKKFKSFRDIHSHVDRPDAEVQAAFFQLVVPATPLNNKLYYFPDYRTDKNIREFVIASKDFISIWTNESRWKAEIRIPLKSFEDVVLSRINGHEPLKMNIDYLDYDELLAKRIKEDNFGFKPDNVYCLDEKEKNVNRPRYMRPLIFE